MAINIKLSNPVNGYSVFKTNQVLTAEHLNSVGRFFDYHDRLTRARLLGVGIACGLHVSYNGRTVTVSKGVGVTSDGDLLTIENNQSFLGVAPYDDKDAQYDLFQSLLENPEITSLWRLSSNDQDDGFTPISSFFDRANTPFNYVVVLYNSQFIKDTDNCSGDDCDGKADMYNNDTRVLLLSKKDYEKIIKENKCCSKTYFTLPEAAIPRVLLNEKDNIFSYGDLISAYSNTINNSSNLLEAPLKAAIETATILRDCYIANGGAKEIFTDKETSAVASIGELVKKSLADKKQGIQYLYDFLKDVSNAYDDFKESAFELCSGCCTPPDTFPKHLALGLLQQSEPVAAHRYRNCFMESPILNNKDEALEDALKLFARLARLISSFTIPERAVIRITPSTNVHEKLETKSIPYYYEVSNVLNDWSPTATRRNKTSSILSYNASQYSALPHVTQPLSFDIDKYPFFRIEGHIGKTYDDAFITIDNLRKQFDLPFDIVGVQLQKERVRIPPKGIRPGLLELLYDKERIHFDTKLDYLKKYNESLLLNLPEDEELNQPAITKNYGDPKALKNMVIAKKTEMDTQILTAKRELAKPAIEVAGKTAWDDMHLAMANTGAQINKNAKLFTAAAYRSPIENLAVLEQPKILLWLGDLLQNQKQKVADGYIFSNFLKQNPSMMHHAGVCKGGTFILVYEKVGDAETVVADFYLPYIAKEELVDSKVDTATIPVKPVKDIDFTISKDILKLPILNADIYNIKDDLVRVKDFTSKSDINLGKRINEFDERINKVGEQVLLNGQNITKEVSVVKDRYESSFSKLIASYDTVVTKTTTKLNGNVLNEITKADLEDLVTGVRAEFNGKILETENKFDARINTLNTDIATTKSQVTKFGTDITALDKRLTDTRSELITKSTSDIKVVNDRVTAVNTSLDTRITQVAANADTKLNTAVAGLNQSIITNAQAVDVKITNARTEILNAADRTATEKLNIQKNNFDNSLNKLNTDITTIKTRIR